MKGTRHNFNSYYFLKLFDFSLMAHILGQWNTPELASSSEIRYGVYHLYYCNNEYERIYLHRRQLSFDWQQLGVPVLDAWSSLGGRSLSRVEYLSDGLHLNSKGNRQLFEVFTGILESSLPQWLPKNLLMYMPNWTELSGIAHQDASWLHKHIKKM